MTCSRLLPFRLEGFQSLFFEDLNGRITEAYLKGERLKGYTTLFTRIRKIGLKAIIEGCEYDLSLLRRLVKEMKT